MKRLIYIITVLAFALLSSQNASAQLSKLHFGNYKITSISPRSFRSVAGSGTVVVRNDVNSFTMSNIKGVVYKNDVPFVQGSTSNITVPAGISTVSVSGLASLCPGIGLMDVISCIFFNAEDYTIDISMTVTTDEGEREVALEKISVAAILNNLIYKR